MGERGSLKNLFKAFRLWLKEKEKEKALKEEKNIIFRFFSRIKLISLLCGVIIFKNIVDLIPSDKKEEIKDVKKELEKIDEKTQKTEDIDELIEIRLKTVNIINTKKTPALQKKAQETLKKVDKKIDLVMPPKENTVDFANVIAPTLVVASDMVMKQDRKDEIETLKKEKDAEKKTLESKVMDNIKLGAALTGVMALKTITDFVPTTKKEEVKEALKKADTKEIDELNKKEKIKNETKIEEIKKNTLNKENKPEEIEKVKKIEKTTPQIKLSSKEIEERRVLENDLKIVTKQLTNEHESNLQAFHLFNHKQPKRQISFINKMLFLLIPGCFYNVFSNKNKINRFAKSINTNNTLRNIRNNITGLSHPKIDPKEIKEMIKSTNELDRFADSVFKNTLHQIKMIRSELKYEYKEFINSPEFINIENQLDTIEDDVYREIKSTKLKIEKNKQKIYKLDKN